jgi:hypothetical protein
VLEMRWRHKSILFESLQRWSEGGDLSPPSRSSELGLLKRSAAGLAGVGLVAVGLVCAGCSPMTGSGGYGDAAATLFWPYLPNAN